MIQKIKTSLLQLMALALLATFGFTGVVAAQANLQDSLCTGANELQIRSTPTSDCATVSTGSEEGVNDLITDIINVFSVIVGIIAVIMIIWGGLKYITSGGDSGNVTAAKNTILYAIIGLIIVALAQFIVRFVLSKATQTAA
jgi:hypothetical protein